MKKTFSLVMVLAMLLSCVAFTVPASAVENPTTLYDEVEAYYFTARPTFDGFISEAEWGESTVEVFASDSATIDDTTPYHCFFYNRIGATDRDGYGSFAYEMWLRWDLNRFYVGVKATDPDKHYHKNGTDSTWNGDALQIRIDKNGPNASVNGQKFEVTGPDSTPWATKDVPDFHFGYVEIAGGFSEGWHYNANKGMTSFSNNPLGTADCVVAPAGSSYSTDTQAGITTYEIGIPWAYIENGQLESLQMKQYAVGRDTPTKGPSGAIGKVLGMSAVVYNDGADATAGWDAALTWGYGIFNIKDEATQINVDSKANTGSNKVTLVKDEAKDVTPAGYQQYNPESLLDAKFDQSNIDAPGVFYDYLGGDIFREDKVSYDELYTLTYDDPGDLSLWGSSDYAGKVGTVDGDHGNVLDYRDNTNEDAAQTYLDTREGTLQYLYPTSYTFEFDIMYTDVQQIAEGYSSAIYNWFGGASVYAYQCGYFFNDNAFKIVNSNDETDVLASYSYDLKKDNWYNWKFQFDNDSCNARLWIDDLSTEADNADNPWGVKVLDTCWRYFYYSGESVLEEGTLLLYRMMNTQMAFDNVKIYNFATPAGEEVAPPPPESGNGGNNGGNGGNDTTIGGGNDTSIGGGNDTSIGGDTNDGGSNDGGSNDGGSSGGGSLIGSDTNDGGSNEGGSNEGGSNEGGSNEGGSNEGGSNEGGSNEGGSNEGGSNEGGSNEGGSNEGGSNEGGSNEGGSNEGGSLIGDGSDEGGSNEGGSNEGGSNEGGIEKDEESGTWTIPVSVSDAYLSANKLSFTLTLDASKGTFEGIAGLAEGDYTVEDLGDGKYLITIVNLDAIKAFSAGDKFFDIIIKSDVENISDLGLGLVDSYEIPGTQGGNNGGTQGGNQQQGGTSPNTGDGMAFVLAAAVVSVFGFAVVLKKRRNA